MTEISCKSGNPETEVTTSAVEAAQIPVNLQKYVSGGIPRNPAGLGEIDSTSTRGDDALEPTRSRPPNLHRGSEYGRSQSGSKLRSPRLSWSRLIICPTCLQLSCFQELASVRGSASGFRVDGNRIALSPVVARSRPRSVPRGWKQCFSGCGDTRGGRKLHPQRVPTSLWPQCSYLPDTAGSATRFQTTTIIPDSSDTHGERASRRPIPGPETGMCPPAASPLLHEVGRYRILVESNIHA